MQDGLLLLLHCCTAVDTGYNCLGCCLYWKRQVHQSFFFELNVLCNVILRVCNTSFMYSCIHSCHSCIHSCHSCIYTCGLCVMPT